MSQFERWADWALVVANGIDPPVDRRFLRQLEETPETERAN